jgi:hypothetical protein
MGHYEVPGMTHIKQNMTMSCWYASAQMLIQWRQDRTQESLQWLVPPDLDAECAKIRDANAGLSNPQILPMAKRLGLQSVPPQSPTPEGLEGWLRTYGPLWVNGKTHIVVIAGIDTEAQTVKVYDPAAGVDWRPLSTWYAFNKNAPDSRDTGSDVEAVFLYVPLHTPLPFKSAGGARVYTVVAGDNLSKIAQSFYGNAGLWMKIYQSNKSVIGANPNKILVGQKLTIP